jgi:chromosome segregation ATPase
VTNLRYIALALQQPTQRQKPTATLQASHYTDCADWNKEKEDLTNNLHGLVDRLEEDQKSYLILQTLVNEINKHLIKTINSQIFPGRPIPANQLEGAIKQLTPQQKSAIWQSQMRAIAQLKRQRGPNGLSDLATELNKRRIDSPRDLETERRNLLQNQINAQLDIENKMTRLTELQRKLSTCSEEDIRLGEFVNKLKKLIDDMNIQPAQEGVWGIPGLAPGPAPRPMPIPVR